MGPCRARAVVVGTGPQVPTATCGGGGGVNVVVVVSASAVVLSLEVLNPALLSGEADGLKNPAEVGTSENCCKPLSFNIVR